MGLQASHFLQAALKPEVTFATSPWGMAGLMRAHFSTALSTRCPEPPWSLAFKDVQMEMTPERVCKSTCTISDSHVGGLVGEGEGSQGVLGWSGGRGSSRS